MVLVKRSTDMRRTPLLLLALAASCCWGAPPPAADAQSSQRLVIMSDLSARQGRIRSLDDQMLVLVEQGGKVSQVSLREVVAITTLPTFLPVAAKGPGIDAWRDSSLLNETPQGMLQLVDGQSLPGVLRTVVPKDEPADDSLHWLSRQMGEVVLPLDSLKLVVLRPTSGLEGATGANASTDDRVFLSNGDSLTGFVAGASTTVNVEVQGKVSSIEVSRVSAIAFANPTVKTGGMWVWLGSGTVCAAKRVRIAESGRGEIEVALPNVEPRTVGVDVGDVRAVSFDVTRLKPLAACVMRVQPTAGSQRRWVPPVVVGDAMSAALGAADIELPGPMTVLCDVPGASRVSGMVERPESCQVWGDCEVYIEVMSAGVTKPLWHQRVNGAQPRLAFNLMLPATSDAVLMIRVEAGENGPVMDKVVLRRPLLLQ